jgi:hypothetical protein
MNSKKYFLILMVMVSSQVVLSDNDMEKVDKFNLNAFCIILTERYQPNYDFEVKKELIIDKCDIIFQKTLLKANEISDNQTLETFIFKGDHKELSDVVQEYLEMLNKFIGPMPLKCRNMVISELLYRLNKNHEADIQKIWTRVPKLKEIFKKS